ncbi:MAG: ARMT1-like domain-containing protein [bacterium]
MKTYVECIPCFFQQALDAAQEAGVSERCKKRIVEALCNKVSSFPLKSTPPEMGRILYKVVKKFSKNEDPFKKVKLHSNELALEMYDDLKQTVRHSGNSLLKAVELAIVGNSIDYGAQRHFDVEKEIKKIIRKEFDFNIKKRKSPFNYVELKNALSKAERILYIGDNAGEIVFDRILIEEILKLYSKNIKEITFSVRGGPIINDVLIEDAYQCGISKNVKIVSNGTDAPGIVLPLCSKSFLKVYKEADLIISKGQGNFESLPDNDKRIFFLFRIKCPVVSKELGRPIGSFILK